MRVSASRLAALVAERLAAIVPSPFEVHAAGANLIVRHPAGWGFIKPFEWVEQDDPDRSGAQLAELMVASALDSIQDTVSEALTEPWPALTPTEAPRAMAPCQTRSDARNIYFWYGLSEQRPTLGFAPIRLRDISREV